MAYDPTATTNRAAAKAGFSSGILGLILVLALAGSRFNILPQNVSTIAIVVLITPFAMLLSSATRDEFIKELLQTSAFTAMWFVFGAYMLALLAHDEIGEFIDLFAAEEFPLQPFELAPIFGLLAFFIIFNVKRFRSGF